MNKLRSIIILAAIANLLTFVLYQFDKNELSPNSNASFFITLCIMALWLTTFIVALELARRNSLFSAKLGVWAILIIQFCTPFPMLGLYYTLGTHPEQIAANNNKQAIHKYYKANSWDKEVKGGSLYPSNVALSYTRKPHRGVK
jgi:Ca2+/H+ antiporter